MVETEEILTFEPLEDSIRKNKSTEYIRVAGEEGKAYIYKIMVDEKLLCYEVFAHKECKKRRVVRYPSKSCFGIWAWCMGIYKNPEDAFERAQKKYYEIIDKVNKGQVEDMEESEEFSEDD